MNISESSAPGNSTHSEHTAYLLEELRNSREERKSSYLLPMVLAAAMGGITWSNGRAYAGAFFGACMVAFTLHGISQRKNKRQIDLLLALLAEQERRKQ
jgi:hypothetical protein